MPDDGLLVDFIPHIATTPELQQQAAGRQPDAAVLARSGRTLTMALDKPYKDVPGTTIFDAEQSRKGYQLNQFCMSLMKAENRERFKADERAYLDEWPMTEEQKQAVLGARPEPHASRWAATSISSPRSAPPTARASSRWPAAMTGMTEEEYRDMMIGGGRSRRRATATIERTEGALTWPASPPASTPRTCRPSAPRSTSARPTSRTGSRCSRATSSSKQWIEGAQARRRRSWSTTTTRRPSAWT